MQAHNMESRIIFIGGVHGVGKTFFCMKLSDRFVVDHVTASALIGRHVNKSTNKTMHDVGENQSILLKELDMLKLAGQTILLDGHFCLLNSAGKIQDIPLSVFEGISPVVIILLRNEPASIIERLSARDNQTYSLETITSMQDRELRRANSISQALGVPIKVLEPMIDVERAIREVAPYI